MANRLGTMIVCSFFIFLSSIQASGTEDSKACAEQYGQYLSAVEGLQGLRCWTRAEQSTLLAQALNEAEKHLAQMRSSKDEAVLSSSLGALHSAGRELANLLSYCRIKASIRENPLTAPLSAASRTAASHPDDTLLAHVVGDLFAKDSGLEGSPSDVMVRTRNLLEKRVYESVGRDPAAGGDLPIISFVPESPRCSEAASRSLPLRGAFPLGDFSAGEKQQIIGISNQGVELTTSLVRDEVPTFYKKILAALSRLDGGSAILQLQAGWIDHAVVIQVLAEEGGTYRFQLVNSGAGAELAGMMMLGWMGKVKPYVAISGISKDKISSFALWERIFALKSEKDDEVAKSSFYGGVIQGLGGKPVLQECNSEDMHSPQVSGTCAYASLNFAAHSWMRNPAKIQLYELIMKTAFMDSYLRRHRQRLENLPTIRALAKKALTFLMEEVDRGSLGPLPFVDEGMRLFYRQWLEDHQQRLRSAKNRGKEIPLEELWKGYNSSALPHSQVITEKANAYTRERYEGISDSDAALLTGKFQADSNDAFESMFFGSEKPTISEHGDIIRSLLQENAGEYAAKIAKDPSYLQAINDLESFTKAMNECYYKQESSANVRSLDGENRQPKFVIKAIVQYIRRISLEDLSRWSKNWHLDNFRQLFFALSALDAIFADALIAESSLIRGKDIGLNPEYYLICLKIYTFFVQALERFVTIPEADWGGFFDTYTLSQSFFPALFDRKIPFFYSSSKEFARELASLKLFWQSRYPSADKKPFLDDRFMLTRDGNNRRLFENELAFRRANPDEKSEFHYKFGSPPYKQWGDLDWLATLLERVNPSFFAKNFKESRKYLSALVKFGVIDSSKLVAAVDTYPTRESNSKWSARYKDKIQEKYLRYFIANKNFTEKFYDQDKAAEILQFYPQVLVHKALLGVSAVTQVLVHNNLYVKGFNSYPAFGSGNYVYSEALKSLRLFLRVDSRSVNDDDTVNTYDISKNFQTNTSYASPTASLAQSYLATEQASFADVPPNPLSIWYQRSSETEVTKFNEKNLKISLQEFRSILNITGNHERQLREGLGYFLQNTFYLADPSYQDLIRQIIFGHEGLVSSLEKEANLDGLLVNFLQASLAEAQKNGDILMLQFVVMLNSQIQRWRPEKVPAFDNLVEIDKALNKLSAGDKKGRYFLYGALLTHYRFNPPQTHKSWFDIFVSWYEMDQVIFSKDDSSVGREGEYEEVLSELQDSARSFLDKLKEDDRNAFLNRILSRVLSTTVQCRWNLRSKSGMSLEYISHSREASCLQFYRYNPLIPRLRINGEIVQVIPSDYINFAQQFFTPDLKIAPQNIRDSTFELTSNEGQLYRLVKDSSKPGFKGFALFKRFGQQWFVFIDKESMAGRLDDGLWLPGSGNLWLSTGEQDSRPQGRLPFEGFSEIQLSSRLFMIVVEEEKSSEIMAVVRGKYQKKEGNFSPDISEIRRVKQRKLSPLLLIREASDFLTLFSRIEHPDYINIWVNEQTKEAVEVELPRFSLSFVRSPAGKWLCPQLEDAAIASLQKDLPEFPQVKGFLRLVHQGEGQILWPIHPFSVSINRGEVRTNSFAYDLKKAESHRDYLLYTLDKKTLQLRGDSLAKHFHLALLSMANADYQRARRFLENKRTSLGALSLLEVYLLKLIILNNDLDPRAAALRVLAFSKLMFAMSSYKKEPKEPMWEPSFIEKIQLSSLFSHYFRTVHSIHEDFISSADEELALNFARELRIVAGDSPQITSRLDWLRSAAVETLVGNEILTYPSVEKCRGVLADRDREPKINNEISKSPLVDNFAGILDKIPLLATNEDYIDSISARIFGPGYLQAVDGKRALTKEQKIADFSQYLAVVSAGKRGDSEVCVAQILWALLEKQCTIDAKSISYFLSSKKLRSPQEHSGENKIILQINQFLLNKFSPLLSYQSSSATRKQSHILTKRLRLGEPARDKAGELPSVTQTLHPQIAEDAAGQSVDQADDQFDDINKLLAAALKRKHDEDADAALKRKQLLAAGIDVLQDGGACTFAGAKMGTHPLEILPVDETADRQLAQVFSLRSSDELINRGMEAAQEKLAVYSAKQVHFSYRRNILLQSESLAINIRQQKAAFAKRLGTLIADLRERRVEFAKLRDAYERNTLSLANKIPADALSRAQRSIGLQAGIDEQLTIDDIIHLYARQDGRGIVEANHLLSTGEVNKLWQQTTGLLIAGTCEQQLKRMTTTLIELVRADVGKDATPRGQIRLKEVAEVLARQRSYNVVEHPDYLVFEYKHNLLIRHEQIAALKLLISEAEKAGSSAKGGALYEGIMGSGKSFLLAPLLAWAHTKQFSLVAIPHGLLPTTGETIAQSIAATYGTGVEVLQVWRQATAKDEIKKIEKFYRDFEKRLATIKKRKMIALIDDASIKSLYLTYIELHQQFSQGHSDRGRVLSILDNILRFFRQNSLLLIDEVDTMLNVMQAHRFSLGKRSRLHKDTIAASVALFSLLVTDHDLRNALHLSFFAESSGREFSPEYYHKTYKPLLIDKIAHASFASLLTYLNSSELDAYRQLDLEGLKNYLSEDDPVKMQDYLRAISSPILRNIAAVLYTQVQQILPLVLGKVFLVHYGPCPADREKCFAQRAEICESKNGLPCGVLFAIPYQNSRPQENSRFANELEAVDYALASLIAQMEETKETLITREIVDFQRRALQARSTAYPKLSRELDLLLPQARIEEVKQMKLERIKELARHASISPLVYVRLIGSQVLSHLETYSEQIAANSMVFEDLFTAPAAMSGTLWNRSSFPDLFAHAKTQLSDTFAETLSLIWRKAAAETMVTTIDPQGQSTESLVAASLEAGAATAIIDAGGLFKGISSEQIAREISKHTHQNNLSRVLFFGSDDRTYVLNDTGTVAPFAAATHDRLLSTAYWGIQQTTGIDVKVNPETRAAVVVAKHNVMRDVLQAVWRLRELHLQQGIYFVVSREDKIFMLEKLRNYLPGYTHKLDLAALLLFLQVNELDELGKHNLRAVKQRSRHALSSRVFAKLQLGVNDDFFRSFSTLFVEENRGEPWEHYGIPLVEKPKEEMLGQWFNSLRQDPDYLRLVNISNQQEKADLASELSRLERESLGLLPQKIPSLNLGVPNSGESTEVNTETELQLEQELNTQTQQQINPGDEERKEKFHYSVSADKLIAMLQIPLEAGLLASELSEARFRQLPSFWLPARTAFALRAKPGNAEEALAVMVDKELSFSINAAPVYTEDETAKIRHFEFFSPYQKELTNALVVVGGDQSSRCLDKVPGCVSKLIILDRDEAEELRKIMLAEAEKRHEEEDRPVEIPLGLLLVNFSGGVFAFNENLNEAEVKQLVNDPVYLRLLAQAKLVSGYINYSLAEQQSLRHWFAELKKEKQLGTLEWLIKNQILKFREESSKLYEVSDLAELFAEIHH